MGDIVLFELGKVIYCDAVILSSYKYSAINQAWQVSQMRLRKSYTGSVLHLEMSDIIDIRLIKYYILFSKSRGRTLE